MPSPPVLPSSDAELRETLDLLGTLMASVSDRVDAQTEALDRLSKTAAEARQAAFAARAQTDPKLFGAAMGEATRAGLAPELETIRGANALLLRGVELAHTELKDAGAAKKDLLRRLLDERDRLRWWRQRLPVFALGALVLMALLTLALPRLVALHPTGCWALGGEWRDYSDGCLFPRP